MAATLKQAWRRRLRLATAIVLVVASPATAQDQSGEKKPETIWTRDTLTGDWNGSRTKLEAAGVTFGLQEQSEVWDNQAGGIRRGAVYDGQTTGSVALDLDKLFGWTGAKFFANAYQIHGRGPTVNLVGNMQAVSDIEATRDTKLYDLWLEQALPDGRLNIRIGQEGANDEFMVTQYGALFLNSSFGFPGLATSDLPSGGPNFPMAAPFVRVKYQATDQITLMGAVFNGDPAPPGAGDPQSRDKGGIAFRLNDHVLAVAEVAFSINRGPHDSGLPGTYKLGAWFSSARFADRVYDTAGLSLANPISTGIPRGHDSGYAIYGVVDQMIWKRAGTTDQGIGVFLQVMGAPAEYNLVNLFIAGGLNWKAPFSGRDSDVFGLGFAFLGLSPAERTFGDNLISFTGQGVPYRSNETVVEATYSCQITPWWTLQPDAQFVVNPGAGIPATPGGAPLKNAFIVGLHAIVVF